MASGLPIVKQIAWISIVPQLLVVIILISTLHILNVQDPIMVGAIMYLLISTGVRYMVPISHRKGVVALKKGDYESSLPYFRQSYDFFLKHKWLDKWRYLVLLSSSRISYKEMALLNIAFCYGQMKQGGEAKAAYERVLVDFPDSQMAIAALNMLSATDL